MGKRRRSRELALQFLYQFESVNESTQDGASVEESLNQFWERDGLNSDPEVKEFAEVLSLGSCKNIKQLDELIDQYSEHWSVRRLSKIDKNILRLAVYEMIYLSEIPAAVSINEAVDLGKTFGTGESGAFINGILDKIKNDHESKNQA